MASSTSLKDLLKSLKTFSLIFTFEKYPKFAQDSILYNSV